MKRPNPKFLSPAERLASVSENLRRQIVRENANGKGVGMKMLAQRYRIPERTVRVIVRDARGDESVAIALRPKPLPVDVEWETLIRPGWQCHGELTPDQARMYPT